MRMALVCLLGPVLMHAGCKAQLERGLDERQANEIVLSLHDAGIRATKQANARGRADASGFSVWVDQDDIPRALATLRAQNLPRPPDRGFHEVFGDTGLIPSSTEETARLMEAIAGELARTLRLMEGVLDARVHVVLGNQRDSTPNAHAPRASVLVVMQADVSPLSQKNIRHLVAGAVPDLEPNQIALVVTSRAQKANRVTPPPRPSSSPWGPTVGLSLTLLGAGLITAVIRTSRLRRKLIESHVGTTP